MKQPKRYAGIIIKNGDEVLMCQRNYDGDMPGQWSVPCGHLHDNENAMVGAKREFFLTLKLMVKTTLKVYSMCFYMKLMRKLPLT